MNRLFFIIASINGFFSVALGAFAAHSLEARLSPEMLAVFETGVRYQMFHALALFAVGGISSNIPYNALLKWSGYLFLVGIILFCGSLYILSITGITAFGMVTPIGGVAFLVAWGLLVYSLIKQE